MSEAQAGAKPKKSVALSGIAAGTTALCTVGRSGNDLHYRGYDILDIAEQCEFEEIAHLLVHERLPTRTELAAYKKKLRSLRGLPAPVKTTLEQISASAHPMDVLRTGCSAARRGGSGEGRSQHHRSTRHRRPPDGFARLDAALLASLQPRQAPHRGRDRRRFDRWSFPAPAARQAGKAAVGEIHAHLAESLRRARIQRLDVRRSRRCRHRLRHVFGHHRRNRRH